MNGRQSLEFRPTLQQAGIKYSLVHAYDQVPCVAAKRKKKPLQCKPIWVILKQAPSANQQKL